MIRVRLPALAPAFACEGRRFNCEAIQVAKAGRPAAVSWPGLLVDQAQLFQAKHEQSHCYAESDDAEERRKPTKLLVPDDLRKGHDYRTTQEPGPNQQEFRQADEI